MSLKLKKTELAVASSICSVSLFVPVASTVTITSHLSGNALGYSTAREKLFVFCFDADSWRFVSHLSKCVHALVLSLITLTADEPCKSFYFVCILAFSVDIFLSLSGSSPSVPSCPPFIPIKLFNLSIIVILNFSLPHSPHQRQILMPALALQTL